MAASAAQYITILDKSNKVVASTKQLKNVFKEAKAAYLERRAEIQADRKAQDDYELRQARRRMDALSLDESDHSRYHGSQRARDYDERRSSVPGHRSSVSTNHRSRHIAPTVDEDYVPNTRSVHESRRPRQDLVRQATDNAAIATQQRRSLARSYTSPAMDPRHVDLDLAYGDFHAESLALGPTAGEALKNQELSSLVTKCKMLLDEANCAQHSVKATIAHLQKNPDAMAAVALTLAEISNLAGQMAPSALAMLKGSAPSVFAMLAAPEFLIAVGVGVGLTVVMFGGYKIIKKIQSQGQGQGQGRARGESVDEAIEIGQLDRIERWRRGIADVGAGDVDAAETSSVISHNTSVEGEYITPMAARSLGHLPLPKSQSQSQSRSHSHSHSKSHSKSHSHSGGASQDGEKTKKKKKKHHRPEGSVAGSTTSSRSAASSSRGTARRSSREEVPREKSLIKSSPLRSMLRA